MKHQQKVMLWLLLLLSVNALQVVASAHSHNIAISVAAATAASPDAPPPSDLDHDGCLLCQIAAHVSAAAPPPAPWSLFTIVESHFALAYNSTSVAPTSSPSHAWQGRAPPLI